MYIIIDNNKKFSPSGRGFTTLYFDCEFCQFWFRQSYGKNSWDVFCQGHKKITVEFTHFWNMVKSKRIKLPLPDWSHFEELCDKAWVSGSICLELALLQSRHLFPCRCMYLFP